MYLLWDFLTNFKRKLADNNRSRIEILCSIFQIFLEADHIGGLTSEPGCFSKWVEFFYFDHMRSQPGYQVNPFAGLLIILCFWLYGAWAKNKNLSRFLGRAIAWSKSSRLRNQFAFMRRANQAGGLRNFPKTVKLICLWGKSTCWPSQPVSRFNTAHLS